MDIGKRQQSFVVNTQDYGDRCDYWLNLLAIQGVVDRKENYQAIDWHQASSLICPVSALIDGPFALIEVKENLPGVASSYLFFGV